MEKGQYIDLLKQHVKDNIVEMKSLAKEAREIKAITDEVNDYINNVKQEILTNGCFASTLEFEQEYGEKLIKDPNNEICISIIDFERYNSELMAIYEKSDLMNKHFKLADHEIDVAWALMKSTYDYIDIEIKLVKLFRSFGKGEYSFNATTHEEEINIIYNIVDKFK